METRAHHVVIGLFVVLVVAAGLVFALWLSKNHSQENVSEYDVVFNEAVNGLSAGSAVMYSGIKVGDVKQLTLDPKDPRKVIARIRIVGNVPIKTDTQARLRLAGVTGTSVIQLSSGTPASPPLQAAGGEDVPVIVATPSPITQLLAGGEDLMVGVNEVLARTRRIMSPDNAEQLNRILHNLERTTAAMAAQSGEFGKLTAQLTTIGQQTSETLARTSTLVTNADQLVSSNGKDAVASAQQAMASLAQATNTINQLVQSNQGALNNGAQSLNELGGTLYQMQQTLAALQSIMRRLNDNPANYLLGRGQAQEFTP